MRSTLGLLFFSFALVTVPGCFGGVAQPPPGTTGDLGHSRWIIDDGLCGDGFLGNQCDLGTRLATGAAPLVRIESRGVSFAGATLEADAGVDLSNVQPSSGDGTIEALIGSANAGTFEVRIVAADGTVIDRAHFVFVAPAAIRCGRLSSAAMRDLAFAGLVPESSFEVVAAQGETTTSTSLACRVDDASGNPLLTARAVLWTIAPGSTGTISVVSDDLLGSTPAAGGTAKLRTTGIGSGTVHAAIGTLSTDIAVTFR